MPLKSALLTLAALCSFAANSILCRLALSHASIDALSFTAIRICSGALALALVVAIPRRKAPWSVGGSWLSGLMLLAYAAAFSLAYLTLSAGTGALILFGAVQFTMIAAGLIRGERPAPMGWLGIGVALLGLVWLVLPGLKAPSPVGAALMLLAGAAWGIYSLRGRGVPDAACATAGNFMLAVPFALAIWSVSASGAHAAWNGILLAATSGALTSGLGYVLWYAALPSLTSTRAAVVQLAVPVLAAFAGVMVLGEEATPRMAVSSVLTLGGVALAISGTRKKAA